jgi:hypothetical protein
VALIAGAGAALSGQLNRTPPPPAPEGGGPRGKIVPFMGKGPPGGPGGPGRVPLGPADGGAVNLNDGVEVMLPGPEQALPSWKQAGQLSPCLAMTADAPPGVVFSSARDGQLRWYGRSDYRLLGSTRLPRPAYQLALDNRRGLLYAASALPGNLIVGPLGDRDLAVGDIDIYDVSAILRGDAPATLTPLATVPVRGHVTGFILSADGKHLYFMSEGTESQGKRSLVHDISQVSPSAHVGRLDTRTRQKPTLLEIRSGGPVGLALAPDARTLYGLAGGRVFALDPDRWQILAERPVGSSVFGLAAAPQRRVVLLERRFRTQLMVLDVPSGRVLSRWQIALEGRLYLHIGSAGNRLVVGTSALTRGQLLALDITGERILRPDVVHVAAGNGERLLRGPIFLSQDGSTVVTGGGHVFHTPS